MVFLSATIGHAWAKEFTFSALNCACTAPDTWVFVPTPGPLIDIVDSDRRRSFVFSIFPVSMHTVEMSQSPNVERSLAQEGFNSITSQPVIIQKVKFLKVSGIRDLGNKSLYTTEYAGAADGYIYLLSLSKMNDSPDQDAEMQSIISSFHFLKPPAITEYDFRDRIIAFGVFMLCILSGLVILLGWGLYVLIRYIKKEVSVKDAPAIPEAATNASTFIFRPEGNLGPFTPAQLASQLATGMVTQEDFAWQEGMTDWVPVSALPRPTAAGVPDEEAVAKRRRFLIHESQLRSLSLFYFVGGGFILFFGICLLILVVSPIKDPVPFLLPVVPLLVGGFFIWVGALFKHMDRRAIVAGTFATVIGMLAVPVGTVIGCYILDLIHGKKGKYVFSKSYRQIIHDTPQIQPKTSVLVIVLLVTVIIFVMAISIFLFIQSIPSVHD
jgi:hypothetical protein